MVSNNIQLEEKLVGNIEGLFFVPSYQRGYRWDESQVGQLLNDIIENGDNAYCLQPLVVRKKTDGVFELIDGQQRLTTIYILLKYIKDTYKPRLKINFTLSYETRGGSAEFLNNIDREKANDNIDYWFMYNAYKTISRVPAPIRMQPSTDLVVTFSCRKTKASTIVMTTESLSIGTTFDTSPSCRAL